MDKNQLKKLVSVKTRVVSSLLLLGCLVSAARSFPETVRAQPPAGAIAPRAGQVRMNPRDELNYIWIPPGTFMMGCSPGDTECRKSEIPSHQVSISNGFWIGQTEVTVAAYRRFASATGRQMPPAPTFNSGWASQSMPITNVNWVEAQAYCTWAGGRLPTEAEWEYSARGGEPRARYGEPDKVAWYAGNSQGQTHDVAQKQANAFGLFDTLGNVWEWVNDWYDEDYFHKSPARDPAGPASGDFRVLRGGSWFYYPRFIRVSVRACLNPQGRVGNFGIRCAGGPNFPQSAAR